MQGVRRMVALTGEDAQAARRDAKQLQRRLDAAGQLQGEQLQAELAALKQVGQRQYVHVLMIRGNLVGHVHAGA